MVDITVSGDRAIFNVEGSHKLWAFKNRIEIPLSHITGVEINHDQVGRWWHGFKMIGTDAPGLFAAGTFYYERYRKLIVQVADPAATVSSLQAALRSTRPSH